MVYFPSELDDKYPAFAKLSERALNSANNCRQTCSEIELACQIVEFHNAALAHGAEDPKSAAIDAVQEDLTSCAAYAKVLLDYAMTYGGGNDIPWLRFTDDIRNYYDFGHVIDGMFWTAIYNLKFWTASKLQQYLKTSHPLLRLRMICIQACTRDDRDGVASFVTETDLGKLRGKTVLVWPLTLKACFRER